MTARKRTRHTYRVFRLESWEAFLQLITKPPYSNWAFRGERDERWPLYSSLSRYLQNFGVARGAWPEQEGRILRIFKRKAHQFLDKPPGLHFCWCRLAMIRSNSVACSRSFGLPEAFLAQLVSSIESTGTSRPPYNILSRRFQAASKSSPETADITSIRTGSTPS